MSKIEKKNEYVAVGGQALMEGIMMRGPKGMAMSLRLPDGTIETEMKDFVSIRKKVKLFNIPILRGIVSFIESMISGYKLLMESAEKTSMDDLQAENELKLDKWISDHFGPKMMAVIGFISMILGVGISFLLFMYLPSVLFDLTNKYLADGKIELFRALFEGVIRVIIFVAYMALVARMKEIRRVYMYHGAEHKAIFCFEAGKELTVDNVREMKRFHPRCGTSFIFVTIILSILISSIVSIAFPELTEIRAVWIATKILMLPAIMGVGFEFIQLAGKYPNKFTRFLSLPGLLMQRITTVEPTDDIIEVAIEAMNACLTGEVPHKVEEAVESAESETEEE
ncbi:MAG: DUF1385 domain-containing protein [Clostridia bacterium]|nr:DUF1385 domain-containing protein [Clostridia bacterium]